LYLFWNFVRAKKVHDGVTHAAKLFPNAYVIMIVVGAIKENIMDILNFVLKYTVKKLQDSWIFCDPIFQGLGLVTLFRARESLVSDIPAGDGKSLNLYLPLFISHHRRLHK